MIDALKARADELGSTRISAGLHGKTTLDESPETTRLVAEAVARAKQGDPAVWAASRFEAFETFLLERIDAPARFRLKLANPLGVGQALRVAEGVRAGLA